MPFLDLFMCRIACLVCSIVVFCRALRPNQTVLFMTSANGQLYYSLYKMSNNPFSSFSKMLIDRIFRAIRNKRTTQNLLNWSYKVVVLSLFDVLHKAQLDDN